MVDGHGVSVVRPSGNGNFTVGGPSDPVEKFQPCLKKDLWPGVGVYVRVVSTLQPLPKPKEGGRPDRGGGASPRGCSPRPKVVGRESLD